jgi:predicted ribosome quality control (RQC) complex YloA/Tae2 family protein
MVKTLQNEIVGLRLVNIFDVNPKTYIFKFAKNERKEQLIIENGLRFHLTTAANEKNTVPSAFNMKFRKFIRSKNLMSVKQIGVERVVDFTFGTDNCYHLILEMYDKGNIVLTDKDYVVLQLLRSHEFTADARTAMNTVYPMA